MRANGNIVVCCNDALQQHIYGNIHEESLEAIWNKPEFIDVRRELRKGKFPLDIAEVVNNQTGFSLPDIANAY